MQSDRDASLTREAEQLRGARFVNAAIAGGQGFADAVRAFDARAFGPVPTTTEDGDTPSDAGLALLAEAFRENLARGAALPEGVS